MSSGRPHDLGKTVPISEREMEELRQSKAAHDHGHHLSLAFYSRDGVHIVPLREGESVVVGRSHPSDVALRDSSLSRQHACFEVLDGVVWVEDLQSTNGTWVDGQKIERNKVAPGAELRLGAAMATLTMPGSLGGSVANLTHDGFLGELEVEVDRARAYRRSLALLMVRAGPRSKLHTARWFPDLETRLRPFQKVALYSETTAEVLLPEVTTEEAEAIAKGIVDANSALRCGLAILNDSNRAADGLMEAAQAALRRATLSAPVQIQTGPATQLPTSENDGVILESPAMKKLFATIGRLSRSSIPVLIQGETGSGKEVVAHAIHSGGKRKSKPLIPVNCGAIPPQLLEATLFGHERGAFTGANQQAKGVFESASGGTVLLDEIGELTAAAQTALLRVLETKKITRVGSTREIEIDVRILAATHRDLEAMVETSEFRQDLLYRLDAMAVRVPALRKRIEDIEPLARRFMGLSAEANECPIPSITDDALELLRSYSWPGNVRELRNAIERAVVIASDAIIDVDDLPERVRRLEQPKTSARTTMALDDDLSQFQSALDQSSINVKAEVQRFEALLIQKAMDRNDWDRKKAAAALGLPLRTLAHKIQTYDIRK